MVPTEFETAEGAEDFAEARKGFPLRPSANTFAPSAFNILTKASFTYDVADSSTSN